MDRSPAEYAVDLLRLDDLDGARRIAETEIERVADQGNGAHLWQLRFVRAEAMRLRGMPEEALKYLESHQRLNPPEQENVESQARLCMHCGYHSGLMGRYEPSQRLLAEAEALCRSLRMVELCAEVFIRQAMIFFLRKDYVASDQIYRAVLSLSERLGGWYFRAMAQWGIGKNLMIQRYYRDAMPWLEESLRIFEAAGARLSISTVWGELGVCHLGLGNDAGALELLQESARIDYESGTIHNYQVALANIGNVYSQRRDFFTALSYYQKALTLAREIKDPVSVKKWTYSIRLTYARIRSTVDEQNPRTA
jgi:tetratricopeptide (TPR) repeat protein